jgi:hypothetical protein
MTDEPPPKFLLAERQPDGRHIILNWTQTEAEAQAYCRSHTSTYYAPVREDGRYPEEWTRPGDCDDRAFVEWVDELGERQRRYLE